MPVFVVGPRIPKTSDRLSKRYVTIHAKTTIPNVQMKFSFGVNFFPSFISSSSKESLAGRTQNGEAKNMQTTNAIKHTWMIGSLP